MIILSSLFYIGCLNSRDQLLDHHPVHNGLPEGYEEGHFDGMRYGLFIPPSYNPSKSYPLIVSLHGSGDTVSWDLGWYHDPVQSSNPCFVLTPKTLVRNTGWGTTWTTTHTSAMKKALQVMEQIREEYHIDENRLYICGTSMGGFGVFSVLSKEPGLFAAAYSICGGGGTEIAGNLVGTPLWIFHGSDDPVVPVSYSRNMVQAIRNAGGYQVRYTEYPGVGHEAWEPAGKEATLEPWLLAQKKGFVHGKPGRVENFRLKVVEGKGIKLSWEPPANQAEADQQIWYYKLFRDNELIAEPDNIFTSYTDTTVTGGKTIHYQIIAVNYFFRESESVETHEVFVP